MTALAVPLICLALTQVAPPEVPPHLVNYINAPDASYHWEKRR